jgi:hypothetical protein
MFTLRSAVESSDPSWENIGAAIWSVVELNTAIICSCLPTLRPLLSKFISGVGLSSAKNGHSAYEYYGSNSGTRRSNKQSALRSISTEELALKNVSASQLRNAPAVDAHVWADSEQANDDWQQKRNEHNHIMVTTETSRKENV